MLSYLHSYLRLSSQICGFSFSCADTSNYYLGHDIKTVESRASNVMCIFFLLLESWSSLPQMYTELEMISVAVWGPFI